MKELDIKWTHTEKVLWEVGQKIVEQYRSNLEMNRHIATGKLHDNIDMVVVVGDETIEVDLVLEDYWKWVEEGRNKGGMPPVSKIKEWIVAKHIVPQVRDGRTKAPTVDQLSWAIAKKIEMNGYQPVGHPLANAVEAIEGDFEAVISQALADDIAEAVQAAMPL